jgi:hypothetical protein
MQSMNRPIQWINHESVILTSRQPQAQGSSASPGVEAGTVQIGDCARFAARLHDGSDDVVKKPTQPIGRLSEDHHEPICKLSRGYN